MNENKMKCALYVRVSTENDEQTTSFEMQKKYTNDNFIIDKVYAERTSGRSLYKRHEQQKLLNDCGIEITFIDKKPIFKATNRKALYECIIVSNTSRWGRNIIEVKQMIEALHNKNVVIWFEDLGKFSNATDLNMTLDILFVLDEQYSKTTSHKVKTGMNRRKEQGYLLASNRLFGFDYDIENKKLIHNAESEIVRNIFSDYVNGLSTRKLANKYKKELSSISTILKNPKYMGYMAYDVKENKGLKLDKLELTKSNDITPIISEELFWKAQEIRKNRTNGNRGVQRNRALTGKIVCAECGKTYHYHSQNRWVCSGKTKKQTNCKNPMLTENKILNYLQSIFGLKAIKDSLNFLLNRQIETISTDDTSTTQMEINQLKQEQQKLLNLYLKSTINEELFQMKNNDIQNDINKLENIIVSNAEKEKSIKELEKIRKNYSSIIDEYETILNGSNPKDIFECISKIEVDKIYDILENRFVSKINKIYFKDFEPIKEYFNNFVIVDDDMI